MLKRPGLRPSLEATRAEEEEKGREEEEKVTDRHEENLLTVASAN